MLEFSSNKFKRGSFLVYIQGVEVPALSVTVSYGVWRIPEASITLPADKELFRLGREDRLQVAIFYLDEHHGDMPEFRLLFDGEITGWVYQNSEGSNAMSFRAVGHTAILTQLFPMYMTGLDSIVKAATTPAQGQLSITSFANTFFSNLFYYGLNIGKDAKRIKRPYDFIVNLFQALFDANLSKNFGSTVANYFFGRWDRMTNFHNRWAPCPYLELEDLDDSEGIFPILKAVQSVEALKSLVSQGNRVGEDGSFWDYISMIFNRVYYEICMLPTAPIATVSLKTGQILGPPVFLTEGYIEESKEAVDALSLQLTSGTSPIAAELAQDINKGFAKQVKELKKKIEEGRGKGPAYPEKPVRILEHITKPQLIFCVPPSCNVIFPSMIQSYQYEENYATQPTRMFIHDTTTLDLIQGVKDPLIAKQAIFANTVAYPKAAQDAVDIKSINAAASVHNFIDFPEEYYKGPVALRRATPQWFYALSNAYNKSLQKSESFVPSISQQILYRLYVAYEFYRERASRKSGAVQTVFNPYIVPGFPGVVFDSDAVGLHNIMYVMNVTHVLTTNSATTSINYSYAQTLNEMLSQLMRDKLDIGENSLSTLSSIKDFIQNRIDTHLAHLDIKSEDELLNKAASLKESSDDEDSKLIKETEKLIKLKSNIGADLSDINYAPAYPIKDIRNRFQVQDKAEEAYARLFFRDQVDANKSAAFDWREAVALQTEQGEVEDIYFEKASAESVEEVDTNLIRPTGEEPAFVLKDKYKIFSESFDDAMRFVSRPVCTLEEYIDFHGDRGIREGKITTAATRLNKGAVYYARILEYRDGPGEMPITTAESGADSRDNWVERLLRYRNKILFGIGPHST